MVVPSASELLKEQAIHERRKQWSDYSPIIIPSLLTFAAGISAIGKTEQIPELNDDNKQTNSNNKMAPFISIGVGAFWLSAAVIMRNNYKPYLRGYSKVARMPNSNKREKIYRERKAEKVIDDTHRLMRNIYYASTLTNLTALINQMGKIDDDKTAKIATSVAILTTFSHLFIGNHWSEVYQEHNDHRKRIYGPITFNGILYNSFTKKLAPGLMASYQF